MELLAIDCDILISTYCVATLSHHAHAEEWYTYSGKLSRSNYLGVAFAHAQRTRVHATRISGSRKISPRTLSRMVLKPRKTRKFIYSLESFPLYGTVARTYIHVHAVLRCHQLAKIQAILCRCLIIHHVHPWDQIILHQTTTGR